MKKKISILLLITVFVVSGILAGCGKETSSSNPANEKSVQDSTELITINFMNMWVGQDSKTEVCNELIDEFNEMNQGKIKVVNEEYPDVEAYRNKIRTLISANQVPDFFIINESGKFKLQKYVDTGKILDFTPYMEADPEWKATFAPGTLDKMTFDGKIMFIPEDKAIVPIWYNKAQFTASGITEFPRNYDDYFEAVDALKSNGFTPVIAGLGGGACDQWFANQLFSNYAFSVAKEDVILQACNGEMSFEEEPFVEAARFIQKLGTEGYMQPTYVSDLYDDAVAQFTSEKGAMIGNGAWMIGQIKTGSPTAYENMGLAAGPGSGAVLETINTQFCAADTGNKAKNDALAAFAKFMSSPDACKRLYLSTGTTWCTMFELSSDEGDPLANQLIELSNTAAFAGTTVLWSSQPDTQKVFAENMASLSVGKMTPEEFCKLVEEANKKAFGK